MSEYDDLRDCNPTCKLCGAFPNDGGLTMTHAEGCPQIYSYGQSPEERQSWVEDAKRWLRRREGGSLADIRENGT